MRGMKRIELTVLARDADAVIEFLGRGAVMHMNDEEVSQDSAESAALKHIRENLERLITAASWLGIPIPSEPDDSSRFPSEADEILAGKIISAVSLLAEREAGQRDEKRKVEEAFNEAKAFANLNAPFSDLDQLSYLTLRVGRLDPKRHDELKENLADRAVLIPLGGEGRVLAAASRKGRFALDSELKKMNFAPITIPEGYMGIPSEMLSGLEERLRLVEAGLEEINRSRETLKKENAQSIKALVSSFLMAGIAERLKARLKSTQNVYLLSGWVPSDAVNNLASELEKLTLGRVAIRAYNPEELADVREGREKVPVSMKHGAFVKGFERLVFSYGAPLYGTIDPTPLVAIFFTVLFGIMFGDLGQGFVLLLLGLLARRRGGGLLSKAKKFSVPLVAVGISSMVMGLLNGSVFTNEQILVAPVRAFTGFLTGHPVDRILTIMPLAEHGGSVAKLFYFFGFTIGVGVMLNSAGLIVNVINQIVLKKFEKAFFAKTGLAGILLFWYALFIALRFAFAMIKPESFSFSFRWFDAAALFVSVLAIFLGPAIWRLVSGARPVFAEGLMVYIVEGFVEILETVSTYVSNTVSFLRVGAFALSHAVLSFIVFRFAEEVSSVSAGTAFSLLILVFGNVVIILLEGMIVAIQVLRLQYYEFFSKFFTETGVEFSPFRFNKRSEL